MIHPFFCYLGIGLTFGVSLSLFAGQKLNASEFFYVPLAILILYYTAVEMIRDKRAYTKRTARQVLLKTVGKYIMWGLVLLGIYKFYGAHPLYRDFTPQTRHFFRHYLIFFAYAGIPYFFLAEKYRYCLENALSDPYLKVRLLIRDITQLRFRKIPHRLAKPRYRRVYLMALIRIHYIPIMIQQIHQGVTEFTYFSLTFNGLWTLTQIVGILTILCWLIDSNNGAMGYFWESWFTRSRFKEIDPYPIHWFVVLMCYVPFIGYAVDFVPFPQAPDYAVRVISSQAINQGIDTILVIALILYVLSGSALNFSTSNLCYKKIQTKGPYAIVRHPATTCKLIFFALAFFRFKLAYSVVQILCYLFWLTVYVCRALAEERFLKRYPDYRAYMKKTRYRFIPGLI